MKALIFSVVIGLTALQVSPNTALLTAAQAPQGTDPGITAKYALGEVTAIDAATKQITIKTDAGSVVSVGVAEKTAYKRLAPGEQSLANATDIAATDVSVGDRVMARGTLAEDRKSVPAVQIIVMTKGDIAKKQDAERMEWRRRGILGVITVLKPDTHEITSANRTIAGTQSVVIPVGDKTEMRRYAPDSIKFSDAKPSSFTELKVGDQLRALGERTEDPLRFNPQKVVTGSFRTVGGVVSAVDPATGEIHIKELEKKIPLTIVIKHDAVLRRFPSEMGMMGGMGRPGGGQGGAAPAGSGAGNGAQPQPRPQGAGGPGGPRPGGGFNINELLE